MYRPCSLRKQLPKQEQYVAYYGTGASTSTDLLPWSVASGELFPQYPIANLPSGQLLTFVNIFTGIDGQPYYNLETSSNGLSWNVLTPSPLWMGELDDIATGNGLTMLVGACVGRCAADVPLFYIATTTDALTWTFRTDGFPRTARPTKIVFSGNEWVAAGLYGTILRSANAVTWVSEAAGSGKWFYKGTYGNGRYVLTTFDGAIFVK